MNQSLHFVDDLQIYSMCLMFFICLFLPISVLNFIQSYSMFENPVSIRTKNQNSLRQKIKPFRLNYSKTLDRVKQTSSMHNLASTLYTRRSNREFTTNKNRPPSAGNPEIKNDSVALKGLNLRASHIPNLSDYNTELILQKRRLQERINFMKEEIARETRQYNKSDYNWKKYTNDKNYCHASYLELCSKSNKLNENITETKNQCYELKNDNQSLHRQNAQKLSSIRQERNNVELMDNQIKILKNNLGMQQKQRNLVKAQLLKEQRVMNSFSITAKQLQNERAMVLLQINDSVSKNKL